MLNMMFQIYHKSTNTYYRGEDRQWTAWFSKEHALDALKSLPGDFYVLHEFVLTRVENLSLRMPNSTGRVYLLQKEDGSLCNDAVEVSKAKGDLCWFRHSHAKRMSYKHKNTSIAMYSYRQIDRKFRLEKFLNEND